MDTDGAMSAPGPSEVAWLDWELVARRLADQVQHPVVVLDRSGKVRLVASMTSDALGWRHEELVDRDASQVLAPPGLADAMRVRIEEALLGVRKRADAELMSRDGRRVQVSLELTSVGEDEERCLIVALRAVREVATQAETRLSGERTYEVSLTGAEVGRVVVAPQGEHRVSGDMGQPCYQAIYGFSAPCVDCPVRRPERNPWPRVAVRRSADSDAYQLIRAQRMSADVALVTINMLPDASLSALNEARVRHLADQAKLTTRERDVLDWLLRGRSLAEVGDLLGISARTVKFHQQNLLNKMQLDSRADLVRLLM